jgi:hypothetical protein
MSIQKRTIIVAVCFSILSFVSVQSYASSPDAWSAHDKEVKQKCLKASNLSKAKLAGDVINFSDEIGLSMLVLKGVYKFDKKTPGTEVCLLNKKDRTVSITEADRLITPQKTASQKAK